MANAITGWPLVPIVYFSATYGQGFLTEHNRQPLQVSFEEVGNLERTVRGTKRGYVVARKRSFALSWGTCPMDAAATVDGFWAGNEVKNFYQNVLGSFTVKFYNRDSSTNIAVPLDTIECVFKDFSYEIKKRNARMPNGTTKTDLCTFSLTLEEV